MSEEPTKKTKFEEDLEVFFPEIAKLDMYSKFDPKIWDMIYSMYEFYEARVYGKIEITFQDGRINHITKSVRIEGGSKQKLTA